MMIYNEKEILSIAEYNIDQPNMPLYDSLMWCCLSVTDPFWKGVAEMDGGNLKLSKVKTW